jgi:activator of HSP90 ATPase
MTRAKRKNAPPRKGRACQNLGKPRRNRYGIPDGMRREEADLEWKFASMYAKEVIKIMVDEKIIEDDPKVKAAFQAATEVLMSPHNQGIKLQAARLILDFCKAKPVAKSEITVQKAEDWLMSVTADALRKPDEQ